MVMDASGGAAGGSRACWLRRRSHRAGFPVPVSMREMVMVAGTGGSGRELYRGRGWWRNLDSGAGAGAAPAMVKMAVEALTAIFRIVREQGQKGPTACRVDLTDGRRVIKLLHQP
jgi:hypothetical protein